MGLILVIVGGASIVSFFAFPLAAIQFLFDDTGVPLNTMALWWVAELGTCLALLGCIFAGAAALTAPSRLAFTRVAGCIGFALLYTMFVPHAHDAFDFTAGIAAMAIKQS